MTQNRTQWVDYAKAIGIILVVYGHVARGLDNAGLNTPEPWFTTIDSVIYSFHMPLFFFLSGLFFIQSLSAKGMRKLMLSKVDSVFYPYVLWSIIQGCLEVFLAGHANSSVSYGDVFSLLWQPRAHFWFLYALFFVFLFAAVVYSLVAKKYSVFILLFSTLLYLLPLAFRQNIIVNFVCGHFVFFALGIIFTKYANIAHFTSPFALFSAALAFTLSQWFFHSQLQLNYTNQGALLLALSCISIGFVVVLAAQLTRTNLKFLAYIGASSMAIYLMHVLAGSSTRILLTKVLNIESFLIHLIVGCLVAVLAPLAAASVLSALKIPFVFSAPISNLILKTHPSEKKGIPR